MKNIKNYILACISLGLVTSCNLDIVPDNIPTIEDHAFSLRKEAEKVLFTCYRYMPKDGSINSNVAILGSGDIAISSIFRSYLGNYSWYIAQGMQKSDSPYCSQWANLYKGIAYCNILEENIHSTPDMDESEKNRWIGEAEFLKAYYHFYLIRMYGPIPIMDKYVPVDSNTEEMHPYRESLDKCFNYVIEKLDNVINNPDIPEKIENEAEELGRITVGIAKALKAKVLVTAASPLFNGNTDYRNIVDNRGINIFDSEKTTEEKREKWVKAAEACREAVTYLEGLGYGLYYFDEPTLSMTESDKIMMNLRGAITEKWNKEVVWGNSQSWVGSGSYDNFQIQSMPRDLNPSLGNKNSQNRSNLGVSLALANSFYTKHGVPIEEDKEWDYADRFTVQAPTPATAEPGYENTIILNYKTGTVKLNLNREHRYYASLGFDGGIWFGQGKTGTTGLYSINARKGGNVSPIPADHSQNLTGIWPKKMVNYKTVMSDASTGFTSVTYPFPIIRMADLYLMYAEALNESGESYTAVLPWIDIVRERSGLKGVKESWDEYVGNSKYATQTGLRQIIMQERRIELAFEGHYFWDVRRWKTATTELTQPLTGWKVKYGETDSDYYSENLVTTRDFTPKMYFWPIDITELKKDPNLVQNYGW